MGWRWGASALPAAMGGVGGAQARAAKTYRTAAERQRISGSNSGVDTAAAQASAPLLWGIGAELAVAGAGDGAGRPEADGGEQGTPAKASARSCGGTWAGKGARYLWAQLPACIYEAFALKCSRCGGRVRLVGFNIEPALVRQIPEHVGERTKAPVIAPARSTPLALNRQQPAAPGGVFEAIPDLEFDQTANLAKETGP